MRYLKEAMVKAPEAFLLLAPLVVYAMYKVGLELWCIAYGLIY